MVALKGNQVEIQPATGGPTEMKHIKHVKYILPADRYISQLPSYSMFGRKTTLRMNPDHIPDLHWRLASTYHNISTGYTGPMSTVSIHYGAVETLNYTKSNKCGEWCGNSFSIPKHQLNKANEILPFVPFFPSLKYKTYNKIFSLYSIGTMAHTKQTPRILMWKGQQLPWVLIFSLREEFH